MIYSNNIKDTRAKFNFALNNMKKYRKKIISPDEIDEMIDEQVDDACRLKHLEPVLTCSGKMYRQQGHKGMAHGMKFDSYWEFAYYLYQTEKEGKIVERNTSESIEYINDTGKISKFYPDFIVAGQYVEVKGWLRPKDRCKMDQCWQVQFVFGDDIKPMIAWLNQHHKNWRDEYIQTL